MVYKTLKEIQPGSILASPIVNEAGDIVLYPNCVLNNEHLEQLAKYGCKGVVTYLSNYESLENNKDLKKNTAQCRYTAQKIVTKNANRPEIQPLLEAVRKHNIRTYTHSLMVATYSVAVGLRHDMSWRELDELCLAALLHDLGKLDIPNEILTKKEKLSEKDWEIIQKHPVNGIKRMGEIPFISESIKKGILQHHENEDGSGYPAHLTSKSIHLFAKIIHICDVYEALISKRTYKEAINPIQAIEYLAAHTKQMFYPSLVEETIKIVHPYPQGTPVELSDGKKGVVCSSEDDYPTRPNIKLPSGDIISLKRKRRLKITNRYF